MCIPSLTPFSRYTRQKIGTHGRLTSEGLLIVVALTAAKHIKRRTVYLIMLASLRGTPVKSVCTFLIVLHLHLYFLTCCLDLQLFKNLLLLVNRCSFLCNVACRSIAKQRPRNNYATAVTKQQPLTAAEEWCVLCGPCRRRVRSLVSQCSY